MWQEKLQLLYWTDVGQIYLFLNVTLVRTGNIKLYVHAWYCTTRIEYLKDTSPAVRSFDSEVRLSGKSYI